MPMGIGLGIGVTRGGGVGWWPAGSELALEFDNQRGFNSIDRTKTTPDSILTYTNPSAKMVYGSDGVLRYAPHNVLTYSEQFDNAAWVKAQATVTADAAVAPDGTTTADTLLDTAVTNIHHVNQSITALSPANKTYTVSVYLKASTLGYATVGLSDISSGTLYAVAVFNLSNGTVQTSGAVGTGYSVVSTAIADAGNGWYRCSVVATAGTSVSFLRMVVGANKTGVITGSAGGFESYLGNGSGVFVWGAQISQGVTLSDYLPTTTAAVYSLPIDHNPTTFDPLGVLIEEQRVNLLLYSEQFNDAAWVKDQATISANAIASPDGTTTADKLVENASSSAHRAYQSITLTAASYTYSVYAKAAERTWLTLRLDTGTDQYAYFDLANGVLGSVNAAYTASITSVGGGWYRCTISRTATAVSYLPLVGLATGNNGAVYLGNGTSGIYIWGAQLEAGAFPTSYIPTTNNPLGVTRLADQVSILTSAFAYSQTEMTIAGQYQQLVATTVSVPRTTLCAASSGNNRLEMRGADSGLGALAAYGTGVGVASLGPAAGVAANTPTKLAFAAGASGGALYQNGAPAASNPTSASAPNVGTGTFGVGYNPSAGGQLNGHIKRLTYFPVRKTNAELVVLST